MKILDLFRGKAKAINTDQAGPTGFRIRVDTADDKIFAIYENCGIDYKPKTDRDVLAISRTSYETLPFHRRAIDDISAMVGNGRIIAAEGQTLPESLLEELNEIAGRLPILSEFNWIRPHEKSLDSLIYRMVRTALKDGPVFCEDRYDEQMNYLGVLMFDSANFEYIFDGAGVYKLRYKANQYPDLDAGYFHSWGYDFVNERPWPNPLISGGAFFLHILTAILVAVRNQALRKAAPLEVLAVSVKNDEKMRDSNTAAAYTATMDSLETALRTGIKQQQKGKGTSILARTPMDIDLIRKTFGAEITSDVDPEILSLVLMGFANLLQIPFEFLGQVLGGTGFSKERFALLFKIWGGKVDNIRNSIRPVILDIVKNHLRSQGVSPIVLERIALNFVLPDIMDEKDQAEISKIQAEANAKHTEVAEYLAQIDTEAANQYLINHSIIPDTNARL